MSNGKRGEGFGFAPERGPARKIADLRNQHQQAHPSRSRLDASTARPSTAYDDDTPRKQPYWVWLLIGLLIGAGGTMLTSSLWLQDIQDTRSTAIEATAAQTASSAGGRDEAVSPISATADVVDIDATLLPVPPSEQVDSTSNQSGGNTLTLDKPAEAAVMEDPLVEEKLAALVAATSSAAAKPELPPAQTTPSAKTPALVEPVGQVEEAQPAPSAESDDSPPSSSVIEETRQTARTTPTKTSTSDQLTPEKPRDKAELRKPDPSPSPRSIDDAENRAEQEGGVDAVKKLIRNARLEQRSNDASSAQRPKRLYRVQLAAVDDEAAAQGYWREANLRLPDVFADVTPTFDRREVEQRLFFRIWVGEFDRRSEADNYCNWLKTKGQDCFVTRG